MVVQTRPSSTDVICEQAVEVRQRYPELFAYLARRDRDLRRALGRVPSPADIELSANWNQRGFVERALRSFGAGIDELAS
jgi:hypothetical protein